MPELNRRRFLAVLAAAPLIAKADAIAEALKPVIYPAWPKRVDYPARFSTPHEQILHDKPIPDLLGSPTLHVADIHNFQAGDVVSLFGSSFDATPLSIARDTFVIKSVDVAKHEIALSSPAIYARHGDILVVHRPAHLNFRQGNFGAGSDLGRGTGGSQWFKSRVYDPEGYRRAQKVERLIAEAGPLGDV